MQGVHLGIPRGVEIKQWIDTHIYSDNGKNWNYKEIGVDFNYVILEDDSEVKNKADLKRLKVKK